MRRPPARARVAGGLICVLITTITASAARAAGTAQAATGRTEEIAMTVSKALILDHPDEITRVSISNPDIADAVAVSTKELLLNAKAPGITTLVIWSKGGERNFFTLNVSPNLQQVQQQIKSTFPGEDIQLSVTPNA